MAKYNKSVIIKHLLVNEANVLPTFYTYLCVIYVLFLVRGVSVLIDRPKEKKWPCIFYMTLVIFLSREKQCWIHIECFKNRMLGKRWQSRRTSANDSDIKVRLWVEKMHLYFKKSFNYNIFNTTAKVISHINGHKL